MSKVENNHVSEADDQIIDQFIRNENNVLEKTYRYNYKTVRNYVMKNSGTEADAKDIFQEAMMIAWLNLKEGKFTVRNEFSLSAYIYKIAKFKWLDKLKSKEVRLTTKAGNYDFEDIETESSDYNDAEKKLNYLRSLYNQLDVKCKEVLNSFYFEKKRLEEIASSMDYDTGSIRTIKYRCMQKLRKMHANAQNQID